MERQSLRAETKSPAPRAAWAGLKGAVDDAAWAVARDALRSSQYGKEIWILAGNILSRGELLADLRRVNPPARARQMIYYIAALLTSAARANIDLKIFCSP